MDILLIGNGAREHALAEALLRSPQKPELYCFMSARNPALIKIAEDFHIGSLTDLDAVSFFAKKHNIDFAFIGPEAPLGAGIVDKLKELNIPSVGPTKVLAQLETSKAFTRDIVKKYNIPGNPEFETFTKPEDIEAMKTFMDKLNNKFVVKSDGLWGGKGVKLMGEHLKTQEEALAYANECIEKHGKVVIEELFEGEEFSLMSFVDGKTVKDMIPAQDHKRAYDGDEGPNTGGMGSYSCANHLLPFLTQKDLDDAHNITQQVCDALHKETGELYKGIMYGGFMLTKNGVKLIEYNARFGDPEAMNVLPLLETDLVAICQGIIKGTLDNIDLKFKQQASVCKYLVPKGYPVNAVKTKIEIGQQKNSMGYYAAIEEKEDGLYMTGSRALALVSLHENLNTAQAQVEEDTATIKGDVFHRKDIGTPELIQKRIDHMNTLRGEKPKQPIKKEVKNVKKEKSSSGKLRVAVLASTRGTDLQALIDHQAQAKQEHKPTNWELSVVISNKTCGALEKARAHHIPHELIRSKGKEREAFDEEVSQVLREYEVDIILLIGYMRILSTSFVKNWKNKIINIHPSLLPAFAGNMDKNVHAEVLKRGCKLTGCTLHVVDEGVDTGPIILQKTVEIEDNETVDSLKQKVQKAEQKTIIKALDLFGEQKIHLGNDKVVVEEEPPGTQGGAVDKESILPLYDMSDPELAVFLQKNTISLSLDEVKLIIKKIKREPTLTELHIFNIEWSEHCSYKSSKNILKMLPTQAPHVILGPQEDAGIVAFTKVNGEQYGIVMAHESHNHPSQVVPFEGAATGVGGIVRDVLCMGAELIGTADPLRFGSLEGPNSNRTKYIAESVIDGIATYGNAIGIPNLGGDIYFHESFDDNCLVNVVCLGLVKEKEIIHSYVPENGEGYDVIVVGKATDNSGFGGAAFASLVLDEEEKEKNKGAVQVPNPFLKNMLIRASYAVFKEIREQNIPIGFKDCGAGGIMCASSELGSASGYGIKINVDNIHTSMELPPFVTACAETQERFVWVVPPTFTQRLLDIYNKDFALSHIAHKAQATVVGKVIKEKQYILEHQGKVICNLPIDEVTMGIQYKRDIRKPQKPLLQEPNIKEPKRAEAYHEILLKMLKHPTITSKAKAFNHYDTEVLGNAVIRPGEADAGLINPLPGHPAGVALSTDHNHLYSKINPYHGAVNAVAEAMSNVVAIGATPYAMTDCLNFGNPEDPVIFHDFVESVKGLRDAAISIGFKENPDVPVPFISGNVSFYNQSKRNKAIDSSPIVACVGVMQDISKAITSTFKKENSFILLLGERKDELGASVYYQLFKETGKNLPMVDLKFHRDMLYTILDAIDERLLLSCHDISEGGLGVALTEMLLKQEGLGAKIGIASPLRPDTYLFSETKGMLVEIEEDNLSAFEILCTHHNITFMHLGKTNNSKQLTISYNKETIIDLPVKKLAKAHESGLFEALQ